MATTLRVPHPDKAQVEPKPDDLEELFQQCTEAARKTGLTPEESRKIIRRARIRSDAGGR